MVCIRGDTGEAPSTKYWGHEYMMETVGHRMVLHDIWHGKAFF
jgi:hypothetical protein